MKYSDEYKLCYIDRPWAYFTTQEIDKQWGDDWNDAPYEHNAGSPYTYNVTVWDRETKALIPNPEPRFEIARIPFSVNLSTPEEEHFNSPYSVEGINDCTVPWLRPYKWDREHFDASPRGFPAENSSPTTRKGGQTSKEANGIEIWAGATYPEFVRLIQSAGGTVYEPIDAVTT